MPADEKNDKDAGLSIQTLAIASVSSVAAALFLHKFWQGGAILGAAFTPIIVALVSEGLRKPARAITTRSGRTSVEPPPVVGPEREDKFGIWEEQRRQQRRRLRPRRFHVKLAIATGVIAFLIAAFFLTGAELVLGGASDSDRFRFVPGKQQKKDDRDRDGAGQTQTDEEEPAPEEEQEEAQPTVTVTTPPEEPEPAPEETTPQTTPVPEPGATTPVP